MSQRAQLVARRECHALRRRMSQLTISHSARSRRDRTSQEGPPPQVLRTTRQPPASRFGSRARWIPVAALAFIIIVVLLIVLRGSSPTTGYDVSYPQCSGPYPSNPLFGIVGVNGGLADNANSCFSGELRWARKAPGQKRQKQ